MLAAFDIVGFVPVRDFKKARAFYEGILGLKVTNEDAFAIAIDANGIMLRLTKVGNFTPAQFTILGWQVPAIEQAVAGLRERGVIFMRVPGLVQDDLGIWSAPSGAKVAWFKDPDGNTLSVSQHVLASFKFNEQDQRNRAVGNSSTQP